MHAQALQLPFLCQQLPSKLRPAVWGTEEGNGVWREAARLVCPGSATSAVWLWATSLNFGVNFHIAPSFVANGNVKMIQPLWKNGLAVPQKCKRRVTIWSRKFIRRYIRKKIENLCSHKNLSISVHCSIIYSSQKVETTQMSTNWWVDKQDEVYLYNGIVLNHKMNQVLTHTTTRINLETIMLNERSQTQKAISYILWFYL